jgi:TRAP-type mannitol/chloroaromatic compound transport system permease small subunit
VKKFLQTVDKLSEWSGKLASFAILIIITAIVWDVVRRYVFNASAVWGFGSYGKLLLFYVVFGAAYALLEKAHVNVDMVYQYFPMRAKAIIDLFTALFFFLFCVIMLWQTIPHAVEQAAQLELSPKILFPARWPISMMIPVGLAFFLIQGLAKFIRDLVIAVSGKEIV